MQTLHSAKTDIVENLRNHFYYISYMIIVYCEYSYEIFFANNSYPMFEERKSKMAFTMKGGGASRVPLTYLSKRILHIVWALYYIS